MSPLRETLDEYLTMRRALGHKLCRAGRLLQQFVAFADLAGATYVTTDLALAHPKATALISCCDFSPLIDLPALKSANRAEMLLLTRYDNESSLQAIRAGAPLVIATNHTDIFNLEALDALAAYFTKKTPVPASVDESKSEIKVIDKSNVPASGFVYSFDKDLATYADRWSTLYQY